MNFIYSIFFTGSTSLFLFLTSKGSMFQPADNSVLVALSIFFFSVTFIFLTIGFFQNINLRDEQKKDIQSIKTYNQKIANKKKQMEIYKSEIESSLMKLYPEYEKEMFKSMNVVDAENLSIYIAKYPELKFNGVLKIYTDHLTSILCDVAQYGCYLEELYERIRIRNESSWFALKYPLSDEMKTLVGL